MKRIFSITLLSYLFLLFTIPAIGQDEAKIASLNIGDFKVYQLLGDTFDIPIAVIKPLDGEMMPSIDTNIKTHKAPEGAFLVLSPEHKILVDVGLGIYHESAPYPIQKRLQELGVKAEEIDKVFVTHCHFDHIGGLLDSEGKAAYPNATIYLAEEEHQYWIADTTQLIDDHKGRGKMVLDLFEPYIKRNQVKLFKNQEQIAKGITAIVAEGHTMGHSMFSFESKGEELWCIGDLLHFENLQFQHPQFYVTFDTKGEIAVKSRDYYFKKAVEKKIIMAASHMFNFVTIQLDGEVYKSTPVLTD